MKKSFLIYSLLVGTVLGFGSKTCAMEPPATDIKAFNRVVETGPLLKPILLLEQNPELARMQDPETGDTSLIAAARAHNMPLVETLLKDYNVNPNEANRAGDTALHAAKGDFRMSRILTMYGAQPLRPNNEGVTAFDIAEKNNKNVLDLYEYQDNYENFIIMIDQGNWEEARAYLNENPVIAAQWREPQEGNTALIAAVKNGSEEASEIIASLLDKKADPNERNFAGETALHAAVATNNLEHAQLLINAGANPNIRNEEGVSALDLARRRKDRQDLVTIFEAWVPEKEAEEEKGKQEEEPVVRPVRPAAPVVRRVVPPTFVIKGAVLIDRLSRTEKTAFYEVKNAIVAGRQDATVRRNVGQWPRLTYTKDKYGNTLLSFAARSGNLAAAKFLLDKDADVNAPDRRSTTPLAYAIRGKHNAMIRLLKERGGLVFATAVVSVQPDYAYQLSDLGYSFGRPKYGYITRALRDKLGSIEEGDFYMPLAYLAIPLEYSEGEQYEATVRDYLNRLVSVVYDNKLINRLLEAQQRDPFKWLEVTWLGRYLGVSYAAPRGYADLMNDFYRAALKAIPGSRRTYEKDEAPHINVAVVPRGVREIPKDRLLQKVERGTPQEDMFEAGMTLRASVRAPSEQDPGYIEYSFTPEEGLKRMNNGAER